MNRRVGPWYSCSWKYSQVQSGGSFDIDWTVTDPADTIVLEGERERQGDYIFTAHLIGEYAFCFSNDMSSFSEKLVDFDIMVESEPRPVAPAKPTALTEQTSSLEESIYKLSGSLSSIQRTQKYFRTRENRNVSWAARDRSREAESNVLWSNRLKSCFLPLPLDIAVEHGQEYTMAHVRFQYQRESAHVRHERVPGLG